MSDSGFIIDTPEGMDYMHNLGLKYALRIEISTGMKHSKGSILKRVNQKFGTAFKRKTLAYEFMVRTVDDQKAALGISE